MAQPPGTFDLTYCEDEDRRIIQGADNHWALSFDTDYGSDWAGFSCRSQLRSDFKDSAGDVLATITCTITSSGPASRIVHFHIPASETEDLEYEEGRWDAEIYNGTVTYRIVAGRWVLYKQVTE